MTSSKTIDAQLRAIAARIGGSHDRSLARLRGIRREYSREVRKWDGRDVVALAKKLQRSGVVHRFFSDELIASHKAALASLTRGDLEELGRGMEGWEEVDCFAPLLSGPAWRAGQIGDDVIADWARSEDRWWRRAALVSATRLNIIGTKGDAKRTLAVCDILIDDRDDMVVKAMSWTLRSLAQRDPGAAAKYIEANRGRLAARVVREVGNKLRTGLKTPKRVS